MSGNTTNIIQQEPIIFHYISRNRRLIDHVEPDFFTNRYLKKLFYLVKVFNKKFQEVPFDVDNPKIDQIKILASRNIKKIITDEGITDEENLENFLSNTKNILASHKEYHSCDEDWIKYECDAWIELKSFEYGLREAVLYLNSQEKTSENIRDIIKKSREIIVTRSSIQIDDDESIEFFSPEAHKQTLPTDLLSSGFPLLNTWLSGKPDGGFERGTVTLFLGEPNVGKSIWLSNVATNMMVDGEYVLFISVEMSIAKIYKRMGSNVFDIDISQYSDLSQDASHMESMMRDFKYDRNQNQDYIKPIGNMFGKKFGSASPTDIILFAKKEQTKRGIKFAAIVIDYFTELSNSHGISQDRSYMYHKVNMNELFSAAAENDVAIITAHQLKGESMGSDDLTLLDLGESKGLAHRPDFIIGIIQTPEMKNESIYFLKNLKSRDSEYKNFKIKYTIDYSRMRLRESDAMIDPTQIY